MKFSGGFSPHELTSFAMPLSVGLTSGGEYMDITLVDDAPADLSAYVDALKGALVPGICVVSGRFLGEGEKNAMASVAAAGYIIYYKNNLPAKGAGDIVSAFKAAAALPVTKKTKKGVREFDLKEFVYDFRSMTFGPGFEEDYPGLERNGAFCMKDGDPCFYALVSARSGDNIRPEFLMQALTGIDFEADGYLDLGVHRTDLYTEGPDGKLISLGEEYFP